MKRTCLRRNTTCPDGLSGNTYENSKHGVPSDHKNQLFTDETYPIDTTDFLLY